jgi:transposase
MQDNASSHASPDTLSELDSRGISYIKWPPFSPDLNPIEDIWNWMKDWIQVNYPQKTITYDRLRIVIKEA